MSNPWFRMYSEFATDPKVQMLSEADQRRFVMLLCMRCSNDGVTLHVTLHDDAVAFQLRISSDEWAATKARLLARGLIGDENQPTNWDKRQFTSDSSKSRVYKHREAKKQASNGAVTLQRSKCNVPDTDTDTDTDTEKGRPSDSTEQAAACGDGRTPAYADLKKSFTGSTEAMLEFVDRSMGGNARINAEQWLSATMAAHGAPAVAQAFAALAEKSATGEIIARPLAHWSNTAAGMKRRLGSTRSPASSERRPAWAVEKDERRRLFKESLKAYQ